MIEAKVSCEAGKAKLALRQSRYLPLGSKGDSARIAEPGVRLNDSPVGLGAIYGNPGAPKPARSNVPAAVVRMPLDAPPRAWAERKVNVQQFTEMPRGGHFSSWEVPEAFAKNLTVFLGKLGR